MPIIKLTQEDINRSRPAEKGWQKAKLIEVKQAASKDKASVNFTFDFETIEGVNVGRHSYTNANTKAPGITMLPMEAAYLGCRIDEVEAGDIDTDKWLGKELWIGKSVV